MGNRGAISSFQDIQRNKVDFEMVTTEMPSRMGKG
jgi:hypothetical protein